MKDIFDVKKHMPEWPPNMGCTREGGVFTFTLTSKTGKEKTIKEHNDLGGLTNIYRDFFSRLPGQPFLGMPGTGIYSTRMPVGFRLYSVIDSTIGDPNMFIGVEGADNVSGQDNIFKGTRATGVAVSSTQSTQSYAGIIQSNTNKAIGRSGLQTEYSWLFGQGKGDGVYNAGYAIPGVITATSAMPTGTSNRIQIGSGYVREYNIGGNVGSTSVTGMLDARQLPAICGYPGEIYTEYSTAGYVFNRNNIEVFDSAQIPMVGRWTKLIGETRMCAYTIPAGNGFSAVSSYTEPIYAQVKAYSSSQPRRLRVYSTFTGEYREIAIPEIEGVTTNSQTIEGAAFISLNQYCLKARFSVSGTYKYYNIIITISEGGGLADVQANLIASSTEYLSSPGGSGFTDILVPRGWAATSATGWTTIQEWLDWPNVLPTERADWNALPSGSGFIRWPLFSHFTEYLNSVDSYFIYRSPTQLYKLPINDIFNLTPVQFAYASTYSTIGFQPLLTYAKSSPFFSCVQLNNPIIKDTTDTLTIKYTLNIQVPDIFS